MSLDKFSSIEMSDELRRGVEEIGYDFATAIQSQAIPLIMAGEDVIGLSQTGSGKTAAFGLPAADLIDVDEDNRLVQVLIICPTRELAIQSSVEIRKFAKFKRDINVVPIYGGESIERQIKALKQGCQIVVGTPGRIMDHMRRRTLKLQNVKMVVLDEADEMLNMGFIDDIEHILSSLPNKPQTLLFSATMSERIMNITNKFQDSPKVIKIEDSQKTVSTIEQYYSVSPRGKKAEVLVNFLEFYNPKVCIVFCNTKRMVVELVEYLGKKGYRAKGLHGDMKQNERTRVMEDIKKHKFEVLVATDVAARGIDINDVELVINFDIPQDEEYFIHRTGRTGRAGKAGMALSLVQSSSDLSKIKSLSKYINLTIKELKVPTFKEIKEKNIKGLLKDIRKHIDFSQTNNYMYAIESLVKEGYSIESIASGMFELLLNKETKVEDNLSVELEELTRRPLKKQRTRKDMVPVMISVGRKDKVSEKHILGAAAGETGLPGKVFGAITIERRYTILEVPKEYKHLVINKLNNTKIKGIKVTVS